MTWDHRLTATDLVLVDAANQPVIGQEVQVKQLRHAFEFGCAGFEVSAASAAYQDLWLGLFDTATLPFYWGRFEPDQGMPLTDELLRSAAWFAERGTRLKGHPLVWHTVKPRWLDALALPEAERLLRARIRREVGAFAGLIDTWDAINEVVIMPEFTNEPDGVANAITRLSQAKGRVEMVRLAMDEARSLGTNPRLVLNDFDLGPGYERLIEDVLAAGITIDAIGLQSHMHKGFRGEEFLLDVCDRFARFGISLHWTETTLVSGELMPPVIDDLNDYVVDSWPSTPEGEERQAQEMVRHYNTLLSHPAVESITYWGMGDAGTWLGAPAGLVRADGTPKPAYDALRSLVRGDWWYAARTLHTDTNGAVSVDGFAGLYEVHVQGETIECELPVGSHHLELSLDRG